MKTVFVKFYKGLDKLHPLFRIFILSIVLMPLTFVLGFSALVLYLAAWVLPPIYGICLFISGSWFSGFLIFTAWLLLLRPLARLMPRMFDGAGGL